VIQERKKDGASDLRTVMTGFGRMAVANLEIVIDFITPHSSWKVSVSRHFKRWKCVDNVVES
jgi:hypothetical protein